jgi:hypothetical protein
MMRTHRLLVAACLLVAGAAVAYPDGSSATFGRLAAQRSTPTPAQAQAPVVVLPNRSGSFKFGVLGDFGTGSREQYELADQMFKLHGRFKYDTVVLVGDNLYGGERPQDFKKKFEIPYKSLLDSGVKFYASLGNHDSREQRYYKLFNMDGKLYYVLKPSPNISFFMLESTYLVPEQVAWLDKELSGSNSDWKIPVFHHPLYSSGERHGSDVELRKVLEPLFIKHNVTVVLTGHDHFYERVKPQQGIVYFVVGSGGKLRAGNIDRSSGITAKGFDTDLTFMAAEIAGDEMYFNAVSRGGQIVDSGVIARRQSRR